MRNEKLDERMLELKEDIFASIRESVAIESVKSEAKEGAPYGEGPKAALDHLLALKN